MLVTFLVDITKYLTKAMEGKDGREGGREEGAYFDFCFDREQSAMLGITWQ